MAGRHLDDDEQKIWQKVARTVRPLDKGQRAATNMDKPFVHIHARPSAAATPRLQKTPAEVSARQDKSVRKGKVEIDAKIDLHDLTRAEAFAKLVRRITRAHTRRQRSLLVVTGKGENLEGVLRNSFVGWLSSPELRPFIASYAQAHIRHGGSGAFYVFLKHKKV